jgi:hypothetical protein
MKGRVKFTHPSSIGMNIDWNELVNKPFNEGRILEAFASADAIIDSSIEFCLRQIYSNSKCQDLINEIHLIRGSVNFDGLILIRILKSKTVVSEGFLQKVLHFKKARNLILHNIEGEYSFVIGNPSILYSSQKELDVAVENESKRLIGNAFNIYMELYETSKKIHNNPEYYFSHEFYKKNPRGKQAKSKFPKSK